MTPEPVTPAPPREVRRPVSTQVWRDVTFLHWRYDPADVRPLLPPGVEPDTWDAATWVGVVGLRMTGVRVAGAPLPYLGTFLETNVRAYSVDEDGRRGVVFLAMEASRLAFALGARLTARLPYNWAAMTLRRGGGTLDYATSRRRPGPAHAGLRFRVAVGEPIEGSTVDHFLTDRWGLHARGRRRPRYLPVAHEEWPLHAAKLVDVEDRGLLAAAGLPPPDEPPVNVLHAPSAHARIGSPVR